MTMHYWQVDFNSHTILKQRNTRKGYFMETIETQVFTFDELSDKAKEKARDWFREGQDNSWPWECVQEDAKQIGLNITELQTCRSSSNKGEFTTCAIDCAELVIANHGPDCEIYKTAKDFKEQHDKAIESFPVDSGGERTQEQESAIDALLDGLEHEFKHALLEDYRIMYDKEIDYQQSDEVVDENIRCNDYTFTVDGKRFG